MFKRGLKFQPYKKDGLKFGPFTYSPEYFHFTNLEYPLSDKIHAVPVETIAIMAPILNINLGDPNILNLI